MHMHRQILLSCSYHMHMNLVFWTVPADRSIPAVDASTWSVASNLASDPGGGVATNFSKKKKMVLKIARFYFIYPCRHTH